MAEKQIVGRIVNKHDIAANWEKATNFIPKQGELIVYDRDDTYPYERLKMGDGETNVNDLPFIDDYSSLGCWEEVEKEIDGEIVTVKEFFLKHSGDDGKDYIYGYDVEFETENSLKVVNHGDGIYAETQGRAQIAANTVYVAATSGVTIDMDEDGESILYGSADGIVAYTPGSIGLTSESEKVSLIAIDSDIGVGVEADADITLTAGGSVHISANDGMSIANNALYSYSKNGFYLYADENDATYIEAKDTDIYVKSSNEVALVQSNADTSSSIKLNEGKITTTVEDGAKINISSSDADNILVDTSDNMKVSSDKSINITVVEPDEGYASGAIAVTGEGVGVSGQNLDITMDGFSNIYSDCAATIKSGESLKLEADDELVLSGKNYAQLSSEKSTDGQSNYINVSSEGTLASTKSFEVMTGKSNYRASLYIEEGKTEIKSQNGTYIHNVVDPIEATDAANKAYVDNLIPEIKQLQAIKEFYYYETFNAAMNDINANVTTGATATEATAVVGVYYEDGVANLVLLKDTTGSGAYTISVDMNINLGGKVLTLADTGNPAFTCQKNVQINGQIDGSKIIATPTAHTTLFLAEGDFSINGGSYEVISTSGTGKSRILGQAPTVTIPTVINIKNAKLYVRSATGRANIIDIFNPNSAVTIENCDIDAIQNSSAQLWGINLYGDSIIKNCDIYTNMEKDGYGSIGIVNDGNMILENTNVYADAITNCSETASGELRRGESMAVRNDGVLTIIGGNFYGTCYGVVNHFQDTTNTGGNLFVDGGTFTSSLHGGFYLAGGADAQVFIKNVTMGCKEYDGANEAFRREYNPFSAFYIGGGSNILQSNTKVYMDNCILLPLGDYVGCVRDSDGERNNHLFISNTLLPEEKKVRCDNHAYVTAGTGTNITYERIHIAPDNLSLSNEIYNYESRAAWGKADKEYVDEQIAAKQDKFAEVEISTSEDGSEVYETKITLPQAYTSYIKCPGYFEIKADSYFGLNSANEAPVSVNGVYFWPNGDEGYINNLDMPEDAGGHCAVNKEYVDNLFANGNNTGDWQVKFADLQGVDEDSKQRFFIMDEYSNNFISPTGTYSIIGAGDNSAIVLSTQNQPVVLNSVLIQPGNETGTSTISSVADPTHENDAANKKYVDDAIANLGSNSSAEAVLYTPQELTEEQKAQACDNIGTIQFEKDLTAFTPPNVLEGLSLTYTKGASWGSGGSIISNQYTTNYAAVSPQIDVIAGQTYRIPNYSGVVLLYDETGANGTQITLPSGVYRGDLEFTVPEGKAKAGIAFLFNNISMPTAMYRETMTNEELDALLLKNDNLSIIPENIQSTAAVSLLAPLKGKTIVNFGDSIFGNARPPEDISTRLAELTGATVHNCGFGGCRMAQHSSDNYDAFSMYRLADAIAADDFSAQEFALTNTASDKVPDYFTETVALLKSIDFNKVDIITIAYGTNDWSGGYNKGGGYILDEPKANPLDTNYVSGALRYSIETILTAYPHIRIVICCPTYRFFLDTSNNFVEDSDTKIVATHTLADCINQEREIAEEYKLTFIDNYHIGINKINRVHYFPANDGAHHNIHGRRLIAEHMVKYLAGNSDSYSISKDYVDDLVGNIETALDNIITIQETLIGGAV